MNGTEIARLTGGRYSTAAVLTAQLTGQSTSGNYSTFVVRGYMYYGGGTSTGSDYMSMYITGTEVKTGSYRLYPGYTYFGEKSVTVYHNSDGTFPGSSQGIGVTSYHFPNGGEAWGNLSSLNVPRINRYANISHSFNSSTEHTIKVNWSADANCDWLQYNLNGGSWINASGNPYTISGLTPGKTYKIKTHLRRTDSQLWSTTGELSATTKDCVVRKNINGTWKTCVPYLNVNGTWKKVIPYINKNGTWKEGIN